MSKQPPKGEPQSATALRSSILSLVAAVSTLTLAVVVGWTAAQKADASRQLYEASAEWDAAERMRAWPIGALPPFTPAYTFPWALERHSGRLYIRLDYPAYPQPDGTATMRIVRLHGSWCITPVEGMPPEEGPSLPAYAIERVLWRTWPPSPATPD